LAKRNVFYSFHFDNDVFRVQQIRNMGVLEGDEPVSVNKWEEIKRTDKGVKEWIDANLDRKTCVVVLIGEETASRKWVKYEIKRACELGIPVVGVRIHNLKSVNGQLAKKGVNPFTGLDLKWTDGSAYIPTIHDPAASQAYKDISDKLSIWIEGAIADVK